MGGLPAPTGAGTTSAQDVQEGATRSQGGHQKAPADAHVEKSNKPGEIAEAVLSKSRKKPQREGLTQPCEGQKRARHAQGRSV